MASIRGKSSHVLILLKIGSCQDVELNLPTSPCEILLRWVRMRHCLRGCLGPAGGREVGEDRRCAVYDSRHTSLLSPIVFMIPLQLLAYLAVLRGSDVDQPWTLAKSVTAESPGTVWLGCLVRIGIAPSPNGMICASSHTTIFRVVPTLQGVKYYLGIIRGTFRLLALLQNPLQRPARHGCLGRPAAQLGKHFAVSCPSKEDPYTTFGVLLCQTSIGEDADLHESRNKRNSLNFGSPATT